VPSADSVGPAQWKGSDGRAGPVGTFTFLTAGKRRSSWNRISQESQEHQRKRGPKPKMRSQKSISYKNKLYWYWVGDLLGQASLCYHMDRQEIATQRSPMIMRNKMIKKKGGRRRILIQEKGRRLCGCYDQKPPRQVSSSASKPQPRRLVPE